MVNGQNKKFEFIDNIYKEYDNQAKSAVDIFRQNDQITAEPHIRHTISPQGFYRGKQFIAFKEKEQSEEE